MKIHHIGYLVKNLEDSIKVFQELSYNVSHRIYDDLRGIDICFVTQGEICVELIAPQPECNLFSSLSKKIGVAPYHICYEADDFLLDMKHLEENGWTIIRFPQEAMAIENRRVAFLYHSDGGMIELLE